MANSGKRTNFENVLKMISAEPGSVFKKHARMLSDLTAEKAAQLRKVLAGLADGKRVDFYQNMYISAMDSFELNYAPIAEIGLEDTNGDVRAASIQVLSFEDSRTIGAKILDAAQNDPYEKAQIAAIQILGQYMFEAAVENRIPVSREKLYAALEKLIESKNENVRRAAVVSFAISENDRVKEIISGYLAGNDSEELAAALTAIRHSMGDDWNRAVLELVQHEDEKVSAEAIRAAGTLQLREALPFLYELISQFDRISPELLLTVVDAAAEIGDEGSFDVLETLGEAAVDMDEEITEAIDDAIDTLNMTIYLSPASDDDEEETEETPEYIRENLQEALDLAKDRCLSILEEKIPHDLEDDEAFDLEDDEDDECECGEHHHHHHHHHDHDHHHDNPLEGMDLSRFRILDDLESYEKSAAHDADEEDLWAEFEDMAEEDLDADSLQDFINKLEARKKKK